jgi:hypothetical protein
MVVVHKDRPEPKRNWTWLKVALILGALAEAIIISQAKSIASTPRLISVAAALIVTFATTIFLIQDMAKQNNFKVEITLKLAVICFLSLLILFLVYWMLIRPAVLHRSCSHWAVAIARDDYDSSGNNTTFSYQDYDFAYKVCLQRRIF